MQDVHWRAGALLGSVVLAGCASPFAQRIGYDTHVSNSPGTISLSDPKLYTREALINERARDLGWIDRLITESEDPTKVTFKPDLFREVEQISAFAAAVGVKFDPAAGLSYRRNKETGDLQQEIDTLKLEVQLKQLRSDIALIDKAIAAQTEPVNQDLNKLAAGNAGAATPVSASATDQLKAAIDKLLPALTGRLDADGKPVAATSATTSPFDDFRDRSAYRDMLKSARNAAALDQLHDSGNARLLRLNFQASVLPDSRYARSLGAIQIRVIPPTGTGPTPTFLRQWLEYLNTNPRFRTPSGDIAQDSLVVDLLAGGQFKLATVGYVDLILPVIAGANGEEQDPAEILRRARWDMPEAEDLLANQTALGILSSADTAHTRALFGMLCAGHGDGIAQDRLALAQAEADRIERQLIAATDRQMTGDYLQLADRVARGAGRPSPISAEFRAKLARAQSYREQTLALFAGDPRCSGLLTQFQAVAPWKAFQDPALSGTQNIRVYEVGPREQVQQVSTVARAANSLSLAASLAGSAPGSGVAADAAASYSRQAMGRATALERVPSVVGYSVAGKNTFGWVLGPRAVLDPHGQVEIEQLLKPYDLSVDLSVPGWWAGLDLEVTTIWAPAPNLIARGDLETSEGGEKRRIAVPLIRSVADFDALTLYILGNQERQVTIAEVVGGPVNACAATTLLVRGDNLWRAERVFVLGMALKGEAIAITPDMRGILVTVPPTTAPPSVNLNRTLYVMTPLGTASRGDVPYIAEPSGDGCKPAKPQAATTTANAVAIGEIKPALEFFVPSDFTIQVAGANLGKIDKIELYGQRVALDTAADGKSMSVAFDEKLTSAIPDSDNIELNFFEKDKVIGTRRVRIRNKS